MKIHIGREGQSYGPYDLEEVRRYVESGDLRLDDLAWQEGLQDWVPLGRLLSGMESGAGQEPAGPPAPPPHRFHHVAIWKFVVLSFCSLGFYELYWFYRNWRYVRARDGRSIWPFWRAVFAPLWCYALARDIEQQRGKEGPRVAVWVALLYFGLSVLWRLPDPWWLLSLGSFVPLIVLVRLIDGMNRVQGARAPYYGRIRVWQVPFCLLGAAVLAFAVLSSLNVLPSTGVTEGERLPSWQRRFLVEEGIVEPGETILFFYSAGLLSIGGDGNLLTDRGVISYYVDDEDGERVVDRAAFSEIEDVVVEYSESPWDDTVVSIFVGKEQRFVLWVSAEAEGDRRFVERLMELWKAAEGGRTRETEGAGATHWGKPCIGTSPGQGVDSGPFYLEWSLLAGHTFVTSRESKGVSATQCARRPACRIRFGHLMSAVLGFNAKQAGAVLLRYHSLDVDLSVWKSCRG